MSDEASFLKGICANPADDWPRTVFADWLDEQAGGYSPRAEFVRVQCELAKLPEPASNEFSRAALRYDELRQRERQLWSTVSESFAGDGWWVNWSVNVPYQILHTKTSPGVAFHCAVRRGFLADINCTLADWIGRECDMCEGEGGVRLVDDDGNEEFTSSVCPECKGKGRTTGIGLQVVAAHPLQTVWLTDKQPMQWQEGLELWAWQGRQHPEHYSRFLTLGMATLPEDLFNALSEYDEHLQVAHVKVYKSADAARKALSTALIMRMKSQPVPT